MGIRAEISQQLADVPLRNVKHDGTLRRNSTHGLVTMTPEQLAAVCFDEACIASGLTNKAVATDLGVSESLVGRWRNVNARECPSQMQLTLLGYDFMRLLFRSYSRRAGWGKAALLDLVDAVGELAEAMEA